MNHEDSDKHAHLAPSAKGEAGPQEQMTPEETRAGNIVELGLNAAIVSVVHQQPQILLVKPEADKSGKESGRGDEETAAAYAGMLPFGPFTPVEHRTLEIGLRRWVLAQTGLSLGYVEQLYTFGDRGRHALLSDKETHIVSIGYLALIRGDEGENRKRLVPQACWRPWYQFLPWEDWRKGKPAILETEIMPRLRHWAKQKDPNRKNRQLGRKERIHICFGEGELKWDEEKVLERYELLYEAGLVEESLKDGREASAQWGEDFVFLGEAMTHDHRRILATAIGRLRGKLKYRPVIFELMPPQFTLLQLQKMVESISGSLLHKQNFRRLVETTGLVEETGEMSNATGGRPAKLFRFRTSALLERPSPGLRVKVR